jgi:glycerol kinase
LVTGTDSVLVIDVGSSNVRAAVVRPDATVTHAHHHPVPPSSPGPGLVEVDGTALAAAVLDSARAVLQEAGPVGGVGVANQRATTLVWERASGALVGPGLGWQDVRTVGTCLTLQAEGLRLAPNASATKLAYLLDAVDPERRRADQWCFGTVDTWVAWTLSGGHLHVTDPSNAAATGLVTGDLTWNEKVLEALAIPPAVLPRLVDSAGELGQASELPGAPPLLSLVGDQQASLVGQGATRRGLAKATFGTGGMLDVCTGEQRPAGLAGGTQGVQGPEGTFPIVAWRRAGRTHFGVEAIMLSAGTAVEWLADDLQVLPSPAASEEVAGRCQTTGDVWFVPALFGLGTPVWDLGARGSLLGVTRGTGRPELVRAVLEGVAHRGADLLEAAEADSGLEVRSLRVDGGMSANAVFITALAEATGRVVELSPELEATTLGAGYLAGLALGTWSDEEQLAEAWSPRARVEPKGSEADRAAARSRWLEARGRAEKTIPELSGIRF